MVCATLTCNFITLDEDIRSEVRCISVHQGTDNLLLFVLGIQLYQAVCHCRLVNRLYFAT